MERTVNDYEDKVRMISDIKNIQAQNGNWNVSPYMTGLFNGLELASSILEGRDAEYKGIELPQPSSNQAQGGAW